MSLIREKTANNRDRTSNVFFRVMMFSLQTSTLFRVTWGGEKTKRQVKITGIFHHLLHALLTLQTEMETFEGAEVLRRDQIAA